MSDTFGEYAFVALTEVGKHTVDMYAQLQGLCVVLATSATGESAMIDDEGRWGQVRVMTSPEARLAIVRAAARYPGVKLRSITLPDELARTSHKVRVLNDALKSEDNENVRQLGNWLTSILPTPTPSNNGREL